MEQTEKPIYKRVFACFCAFLICCLVAFCGFSIPKVHAESIADQWDDYIDSQYFEGAYALIEEASQMAGDYSPVAKAVNLALFACEFIEAGDYKDIPISAIDTIAGYYNYSGHKHMVSTTMVNSQYFAADEPIIAARSDQFELRVSFAPVSDIGHIEWNAAGYTGNVNLYCIGNDGTNWSWQVSEVKGAPFFTSNYTGVNSSSYRVWLNYYYTNNSAPTYDSNTSIQSKFAEYTANGGNSAMGGQRINFINMGDSLSEYFGIDSNTTVSSDSILDFVIYDLNPVIIQEYPEFEQYLFNPIIDPTETTSASGCGCHVDVYVEPTVIVNVEPTIIVDNNIHFPSEWYTDYTAPSIPSHETIPFPTQDTSNTEPVTMPTMDVDEYKQTYGNAIEFWFYLAAQLIKKLGLELLTGFAFVLSVVGFVLWRLGSSGGGKND